MIDDFIKYLKENKKGMQIKKSNQEGICIDLDHAIFNHNLKKINDPHVSNENIVISEVEVQEEINYIADIDKIAFRLFGEVAEDFEIIERKIKNKTIIYELISGCIGSNVHLHRVEITFTGNAVMRALGENK